MKEAPTTGLQWIQTGDLDSQLISEGSDEPFAKLKWAKKWGSLATGESADGKWTFKRVGFLHPKVTIRETGTESDIATFSLSWGGDGVLEIPSEASAFLFKRTSMWHSEWILKRNDSEETVLTIRPDFGLTKVPTKKKLGAEVELGQNALAQSRLSLLALFTWYLIILMTYDDYASYSGGITASIVASTMV
jgi:hypothetical protein